MADDTSTTSTDEAAETATEAQSAETKTADVPNEVKAALRKANKEAETLRLRLKEFEDAQKTEAQKLAERAEAAERSATEHARQLARYKVAAETAVPASLLSGDDETSIAEHAAALLAWREATASAPQGQNNLAPAGPRPDLSQGARDLALNGDPIEARLKQALGIH